VTGDANRPLTPSERKLAQWMLEHGTPEAASFLSQLKNAEVTPLRCPCGCASFNFQVRGMAEAPPGVHILGDFVFGAPKDLAGIFIFSSAGILSGVEVFSLAGQTHPKDLPTPEELRSL
jgi:hypothetical protein